MADVTIPTDVIAGEPTEADTPNTTNEALEELTAGLSLVEDDRGPLNGSFEFDFDTDGEPDEWDVEDFSGGTHALDTTNDMHGAKALACTTTVGGGWSQATSDGFVPCTGGTDRIELAGDLEIQTATQRVRFQILFYDDAKTSVVGTSSIFDASVAVGQIRVVGNALAPNTARYYKTRLIAGESGGSTAAVVILDGIRSEVFRGIVYQNAATLTPSGTTYTVSKPSERVRAALIFVNLYADEVAPNDTTWTITGNSKISFVGPARNNDSINAQILVELDINGEFTIVPTGGTPTVASVVKLVGYEV